MPKLATIPQLASRFGVVAVPRVYGMGYNYRLTKRKHEEMGWGRRKVVTHKKFWFIEWDSIEYFPRRLPQKYADKRRDSYLSSAAIFLTELDRHGKG